MSSIDWEKRYIALADQHAAIVARAEKAEQERDRYRGDAATHRANARGWMKTSEEWQAAAEGWEYSALKAERERGDAWEQLEHRDRELATAEAHRGEAQCLAAEQIAEAQAEATEAVARAEKAEEERDQAEQEVRRMERSRDSWRTYVQNLGAAQPSPLTPDAITDKMVERARREWLRNGGRDYRYLTIDLGYALRAALTEPPPRPEGAEDLKHPVIQSLAGMNTTRVHGLTQEDIEGLCDRLAERGVRVTGDAS